MSTPSLRSTFSRALTCALALVATHTLAPSPALAQKGPYTTLTALPQDHEYQKTLRSFMATLKEKDFDHGVTTAIPLEGATPTDPEYLYRQHILTMMHQPLIGTKRGTPAVNAPPGLFVLSAFETPKGVMQLPVWPETLASFIEWEYPPNPYRNSRALKLRAFVGAAAWMILFDNFAENNDSTVPPPIRPDWHGYNPVFFAAGYPAFKEVLPPNVQKAFEAGMKKVGLRILGWGVRGESCETDLMAPLGLAYIARALNDPEFTKLVEERIRLVSTDPRNFHPSGYWVERGGPELGFGGAANLYGAWMALMSDRPYLRDAMDRAYRLRSLLVLPEPDGKLVGPTHFNARLGSFPHFDQFGNDGARDVAASLVTDHAACFVTSPSPEQLKTAPYRRAAAFAEDLKENPRITDAAGTRYIRNDEIKNEYPWKLRMWMTYNFPISLNPAYEFYKPGSFAHRREIEQKNPQLLKFPVLRGQTYLHDLDKAFLVTRQESFAAIVHTGPLAWQKPNDNKAQFPGPLGFGGGQLSAFWTPKGGSAILSLRRGMSYGKTYDTLEEWRTWPIHAVTGATDAGKVFTSARIVTPAVTNEIKGNAGSVSVKGQLVGLNPTKGKQPFSDKDEDLLYDDDAPSGIDYARAFAIDARGVAVETSLKNLGAVKLAELYETLPVFFRDPEQQPKAGPAVIEFQGGSGAWAPLTEKEAQEAKAVRITRFDQAVVVKFDKPRRVKLSPAPWADTWFHKSIAQNVLIDLSRPASGEKAEERLVKYRIEPAAP